MTIASDQAAKNVDNALLEGVAYELHGLARSLDSAGCRDTALHVYAASASIDKIVPAQIGWWSTPFNGQEGRARLFLEVLEAVRPSALIETGAFRGTTTAFMAEHHAGPVYSCELDPRWHSAAEARLAAFGNVVLCQEDSRHFLRRVLQEAPPGPLVIYLDAHWFADLPLREELQILLDSRRSAAAMIDDFAVPWDPGYSYDDFGPGRALCVEILAGLDHGRATLFFPTLPATQETGERRGCAMIGTGDVAEILSTLTTLRAHPWPDHTATNAVSEAPGQAPDLSPLQRLVHARATEAQCATQEQRAEAAERRAMQLESEVSRQAEADKALARYAEAAAEARRSAEADRQSLALVHASTSWRITAPLRSLRRWLGR